MPKYRAKVKHTIRSLVYYEAENEDEAWDMADEFELDDGYPYDEEIEVIDVSELDDQ